MKTIDFIDSNLLKENIKSVRDDTLGLAALLAILPEEDTINDCIRKTMIIYTTSIIEALLLWKLNKEINAGNIALRDEWELKDIGASIPLKSKDGNAIVIAEKIRKVRTIEKINFKGRIDLCERHKIIREDLIEKLHEARNMRNKLHIDGSEKVRKKYSQKDVDFIFAVQEETRKAVR